MLKYASRALIAIGLLYVVVSASPVTDWWARGLSGAWNDPKGDVLIVLGGDYLGDSTIGLHSYWRTGYAARAWRAGGIRQVLVSGRSVGDRANHVRVHDVQPAQWERYPSRVEANTERVLDLFEEWGVRGTFFILGWVAERKPGLVRKIVERGHEPACHSYWHRMVYRLNPQQFREDTQ